MFDHLQSLVGLNNGNQFLVEYVLNYFAGGQKRNAFVSLFSKNILK